MKVGNKDTKKSKPVSMPKNIAPKKNMTDVASRKGGPMKSKGKAKSM